MPVLGRNTQSYGRFSFGAPVCCPGWMRSTKSETQKTWHHCTCWYKSCFFLSLSLFICPCSISRASSLLPYYHSSTTVPSTPLPKNEGVTKRGKALRKGWLQSRGGKEGVRARTPIIWWTSMHVQGSTPLCARTSLSARCNLFAG